MSGQKASPILLKLRKVVLARNPAGIKGLFFMEIYSTRGLMEFDFLLELRFYISILNLYSKLNLDTGPLIFKYFLFVC